MCWNMLGQKYKKGLQAKGKHDFLQHCSVKRVELRLQIKNHAQNMGAEAGAHPTFANLFA